MPDPIVLLLRAASEANRRRHYARAMRLLREAIAALADA